MYYAILFIFVHYYLGKMLKFVFCALFDSVGFIKKQLGISFFLKSFAAHDVQEPSVFFG